MATGFYFATLEELEKAGYIVFYDARNWFQKLLKKPVDKRYYYTFKL